MNGTKTNFESIMALNSNGEITGDVITTSKVDNRGYGYIGMNARERSASAARPAPKRPRTFAKPSRRCSPSTAPPRMTATTAKPPLSSSTRFPTPPGQPRSRPIPDFEGCILHVDVDGNPIYTADMTPEETYAAAIEAAKGYLIAARLHL